jgi:hypothetical protein
MLRATCKVRYMIWNVDAIARYFYLSFGDRVSRLFFSIVFAVVGSKFALLHLCSCVIFFYSDLL